MRIYKNEAKSSPNDIPIRSELLVNIAEKKTKSNVVSNFQAHCRRQLKCTDRRKNFDQSQNCQRALHQPDAQAPAAKHTATDQLGDRSQHHPEKIRLNHETKEM